MKLTAPIFILKQQARVASRREKIPLNQALDRIARREGFSAWSQLAAAWSAAESGFDLYSEIRPGNLVLIAARPGQGKTLLGIRLAIEAASRGGHSAIFSLEFTRADIARCCAQLDADPDSYGGALMIDTSDAISADYIAGRLASAPRETLVVIDYLQLLDQKRENPPLENQVAALKRIAQSGQFSIVCLSQVDRNFDPDRKACPGLEDLRLPNPVDISAFDKACFLSRGRMHYVPEVRGLSGNGHSRQPGSDTM